MLSGDICRASGDTQLAAKNKNEYRRLFALLADTRRRCNVESLVRRVWLFPFRAREQGVECDERYLEKHKLPGTAAGARPDSAMRRQPKAKNLAFSAAAVSSPEWTVLCIVLPNCIVSLSLNKIIVYV